ncbi:MAG: bifunctional glutamate N-acetyltransferase/amino-acid acetyltransferase ArgJ [Chloroflexi bacterium]|nr:bifunctional glutamate N-acetyltransferase/amino-acid acetyltransferase ArgJ [Chloroflexota bacterium]
MELPLGFSFAGVHCGIKPDDALDLALVLSETPCAAAATFTQNRYAAAPVEYDRRLLSLNREQVQAVLINSGNANAITGALGMAATRRSAEAVEAAFGLSPWSTLVMSTGVIGVPLPVERIEKAMPRLYQALAAEARTFELAARAIMTTDTRPKMAAVRGRVGHAEVTVAGFAKGAGMIHPNMATMLALMVTDAAIAADALQEALNQVVNLSFNRISVDGDTSTNDTVAALANGLAGNSFIETPAGPDFEAFVELLLRVASSLAKAIVRDGEGATKFVTIHVSGLSADEDAHRVANAIAISPLVKTAVFGGDANWGRILVAAGNSGVEFEPKAAKLRISGGPSADAMLPPLLLVSDGEPTSYREADAAQRFAQPELLIDLELGSGPGQSTVWTCDLSYEYVRINAEYRT